MQSWDHADTENVSDAGADRKEPSLQIHPLIHKLHTYRHS